MNTQESLGNIAIVVDDWMFKHNSVYQMLKDRVDHIEDPAAREAIWFLSAFVFGIVRRMGYMYVATRDFGLRADGDLATAVELDNERIRTLVNKFLEERDTSIFETISAEESAILDDWCPFIHGPQQNTLNVLRKHGQITEKLRGNGRRAHESPESDWRGSTVQHPEPPRAAPGR
jgi:hypothetical protein